MKQFCRCSCYFSQNLFVPSLQRHVTFHSVEQFRQDYSQICAAISVEIPKAIAEAQSEIVNRQNYLKSFAERRKVLSRYKLRNPELLQLKDCYLDPAFLALGKSSGSDLLEFQISHEDLALFQIPVFTEEFCDLLCLELSAFAATDLPKPRPNTMNNYGVLLDELGFRPFFDQLRDQYCTPLARLLFSDHFLCPFVGLDSHKVFTVSYSADGDRSLAWHFDNAEVTLNVALTNESYYNGGELVFCGAKSRQRQEAFCSLPLKHKKGWGILHKGCQSHSALPVDAGQRENLILWLRSSPIRNACCPMCGQVPSLVPVSEVGDYGDGFVNDELVVNVCGLL